MYEWSVPATRKNRLNNPLRQLRLILGDGEKPLGQEAFARRINMSVATIRAIEGGRRPFSKQCQKQILATLSAGWNPRKRQWCLLWTTEPYKREYQDFSRSLDSDDRYFEDLSVHMLIERLLLLFGSCRGQQRFALLNYLSDHLRETAKEFGLKVKLDSTEPIWSRSHDLSLWGKRFKELVILPQYKTPKTIYLAPGRDAGGIFDFREYRTFRPADYPLGTSADSDILLVNLAEKIKQQKIQAEKDEILAVPIPYPNQDDHDKSSFEKVPEEK
jgi:hypothetical protein